MAGLERSHLLVEAVMNIESVQLDLQNVADTFNPPAFRNESKIHVSDLRDALLETLGLRKEEEDDLPQWVKNLGSFGLIWEKVLWEVAQCEAIERGLVFDHGDSFHGPLVLEVDSVVGSLDGIIHNGPPVAVWECKTRWKDVELPTENERYMIQAKAYCWMAGVTQCWFPVLNIGGRPPDMTQWLHIIDFTAMELMENWQSLLRMKPMVERKKYGNRT